MPLGAVGRATARFRDFLAGQLVRRQVHPNTLSFVGVGLSLAVTGCLAAGAGHVAPWAHGEDGLEASAWPLAAAVFLFLAGAMDILDGATARIGRTQSRAGAFLDSTLDRIADSAIYLGCAIHFSLKGHVTLVTLSFLALTHAYLISYIKARASEFVEFGEVGYWQRPERYLAMLIAALLGHVPAALWLTGVAPAATVWKRLRRAQVLLDGENAAPLNSRPRERRGYEVVSVFNVVLLVVLPWLHPWFSGESDPLRVLLGG